MSWNCKKIECPFSDKNDNCTFNKEEYGGTCCLTVKHYQHPYIKEAFRKARWNGIDDLLDLIDRLLWNYNQEVYKDLFKEFKKSAALLKGNIEED